ncbi:sensor histidine kinase [Streptomyces sp. NPDC050485]|uniref:sensor histidine kinase n=1 Tax=Streptomyces sp. NPDC050485 TaxID=3365617 RepID=UPI0037BBD1DE
MISRLPVQTRTAVLAGLVALVLCSAGAWWLRDHLYDAQFSSTLDKARVQARTVAHDLVIKSGTSTHVPTDLDWPYVVVRQDGAIGSGGGGTDQLDIPLREVPPAPVDATNAWTGTVTVHTGAAVPDRAGDPPPAASIRLAHRTFTAVGAAITTGHSDMTIFGRGPETFTVYVLALPDAAQAAADQLNGPLLAGVPLIALLVAVTAYASIRHALRPVDAIRGELAEISEHHLARRVPVPQAKDEIQKLALTTNATLDRLERSTEQQRRFVADAAHELRSPLTALQTRLEVSLAHPEHTDWPRTASESLAATRRLRALTEDLLFLTRPNHQQPTPALVDLAGTARELVDELRLRHPYGPYFTAPLPAVAPVRGNPLQLHRLLRNLLDNATRHARTTVTVTIEQVGETTWLRVFNDGSPIPPEERDRIFERFTRLDEARDRDAGGSGLGLAIAQDIATRHHGTLKAVAPGPEGGATFLLRLPTADSESV